MVIIEKTNDSKCYEGCRESSPYPCECECKRAPPHWKSVWRFFKKLKRKLSSDLAVPLLGMYPKEQKSADNRGTCTPMFIAAPFTIATLWNQPTCQSPDE
jgi:hypothetical protein